MCFVRPAFQRILFVLIAVLLVSSTLHTRGADTIQWKNIGPGGGGNMLSCSISPANPNIVLQGSDVGGIYRTADGGVTWSLRNTALIDPTRFSSYGFYGHFGFDPVNANNVYFGPQRSTDAGLNWTISVDESQMTAGGGVVDPDSPNIVYVFGYGNIYRSSDRWVSSSCQGTPTTTPGQETVCSTTPPGATCAPKTRCYQASCLPIGGPGPSAPGCFDNYTYRTNSVVLDPVTGADPYTQRRLLACTDVGLFQSTDSAKTWTQITPVTSGASPEPLPSPLDCANMTLFRNGSAVTVFMATKTKPLYGRALGYYGTDPWTDIDTWKGGLFKSTDWGATWTSINGTDDANILYNPGFEVQGATSADADGWSRNPDTQVSRVCNDPENPARSGSCAMLFTNTDSNQLPFIATPNPATFPVQGGTLYKLSGWYKVTNGTGWITYSKVWWDDINHQPVLWPGLTHNSVEPWYQWIDPGSPMTFGWRRFQAFIRTPDAARFAYIEFRAGAGTIMVDDVSLTPTHQLPKVVGQGHNPYFVYYLDLVVDPTDINVLYTGTERSSFLDISPAADIGGVWKTTDGGVTWSHVTHSQWHDNVQGNGTSNPACGDNVCGGRWETCDTCPEDCADNEPAPPTACCGNGVCQSPAETYNNCLVDCPFDADSNPRPYYENAIYWDPVSGNTYWAARGNGPGYPWALAIGSGAAGHNTLFFGAEHVKTTDGGATWTEVTSDLYTGPDSDPGTLAGRGDTNDVFTWKVVHDTRGGHNWLFYGDADNVLQVSYNGGKSFALEGWQWFDHADTDPNTPGPGVVGDAATSIVLDPVNSNRIYVGVSTSAADYQYDPGSTCCGGVIQGDYTAGTPPAVGQWTWTGLGDQSTFPKGQGGVDLLRTSDGTFYAAIFGKGVYKLTPPISGTTPWVNTGSNWSPVPAGWKLSRIIQEPTTGRLYVSVGTTINTTPASNETGVWESNDNGATWTRINDAASGTGSGMDKEPVFDILASGPNTLLAGTWYAYQTGCSTDPCPTWNGDGGLYKGTRGGGGNWTWAKVLPQPLVTAIAQSPASSSILYAFVGQICCSGKLPGQQAGIYKSKDGGNTWSLLQNNGLMNLGAGYIYYSANDPKKLYAATIGSGVFEGTITCGPISEGFADSDGDGTPDCEDGGTDISVQVSMSEGSIVSGTHLALNQASADDTYERLKEQTNGSKRKLTKIWTFNNVPTGKPYELRVEGHKVAGGGSAADNFNFAYVTKASGTCGTGDGYGSIVLTVSKPADDDQLQIVSLGTLSNPVVCLRVQDSARSSDSQTDELWLDRVFLYGLPPCTDNDGDGYTTSCTSCTNAFCPSLLDCDDTDAQESPGLTEGPVGNPTCSDTKDNNCNGLIDAADTAACSQAPPDGDADADSQIGPGSLCEPSNPQICYSYLSTLASDDVRQKIFETLQGNKSKLVKTWRFDNVPIGSSHKLHLEGIRPANPENDNFQFYYSTNGVNFTIITGALISAAFEPQGGIDYNIPVGTGGTWYIRVQDTNTTSGTQIDSVHVDHLLIKTVP